MSGSEDKLLRLQAALDGELDAEGMLAFERDCAADPALAQAFVRAKALDEALRRAVPIEPAPAALRDRIEALSPPSVAPVARRRWIEAPPPALAASLLLGVLVGFGGGLLRHAPPSNEMLLASAFMRTQIGGQAVDIANSDRHVVKPWLAHRAPLSVAALDLSASGYPLAGGRVEALDGRIAPTLVYTRREHRIDVTELPLVEDANQAARFSSADGLHLARWSDADRAYVAVSDLPQTELAEFVNLFRASAAGEREGPPK